MGLLRELRWRCSLEKKSCGYDSMAYSCPICCSEHWIDRISRSVGGNVFECGNCGHLSVYPMPGEGEVTNLYSESGIIAPLCVGKALYDNLALDILRKLDNRSRLRILDVGCGLGEILDQCARFGHRVKGLEVTKSIVEHIRQRGHDVEQLPLEQADKLTERYDWVICLDVIEHLRDPILAIQRLAELVDEGGYILIQSPNGNAVSRYRARSAALTVDPEHLHYFQPKILCQMFEAKGVKTIGTYFYPASFGFGSAKSKESKRIVTDLKLSTIYRREAGVLSFKEYILRDIPFVRAILRSCVQVFRRICQFDQISAGNAFAFILILRKNK